jgi:hypothetical protein
MRLHRDDGGTVWVVHDDAHQTRLADLAPEDRTELLDELVHDSKPAQAASINNAGEDEQLAYLLDGGHGGSGTQGDG